MQKYIIFYFTKYFWEKIYKKNSIYIKKVLLEAIFAPI